MWWPVQDSETVPWALTIINGILWFYGPRFANTFRDAAILPAASTFWHSRCHFPNSSCTGFDALLHPLGPQKCPSECSNNSGFSLGYYSIVNSR